MLHSRTFKGKDANHGADFVQALEKAGFLIRAWHEDRVRVTLEHDHQDAQVDKVAEEVGMKPITEWENKE